MLKQLEKDLAHSGCVLVRYGRHRVWRTPLGANLVLPSSASDWRSEHNSRALARRLGLAV
jgi:hypothetical protein